MMRLLVQSIVCLLVAVLLGACGARKEYSVAAVDIDRPTWDSLVVNVTFARRTSIGRSVLLPPDSTLIVGYNESFDTLFAGGGPGFDFPDFRLGDREGVILEVCGAVRGRWICDQTGIRASPKRMHVDADVDFPIDGAFARGRYAVTTSFERDALAGDGVERIRFEGTPRMMLEAFVDGAEEARVRVPIDRSSGTFDLSRSPDYSNFRFYLDSQMMDDGEAVVHFTVYAGLESPDEPVARVMRTVSAITREDRLANVDGFARQAARILIDDLASFLGGRRIASHVHSWHHDASSSNYEIDMEIRWRGSFFDQRDYVLEGILVVGEDGSSAVFRIAEGNRPALERWDRRFGGNERYLGDLAMVRPIERYRPGQRPQGAPL